MSKLLISTTIDQWKNNKKYTTYMWATRKDLWSSHQEYFMPDEIEVRGKYETHMFKQRGQRRKEIDREFRECMVYLPANNENGYYWLPDLYVLYDD